MSSYRPHATGSVTNISVAITAVVVLLAGCGSENSTYCTKLDAASTTLKSLEAGDVESLQAGMDELHKLAKSAPQEVSAQWKLYDQKLTTAEKALEDSGLKISDFESIVKGKLPRGVKPSQVSKVVRAFDALKSPKATEATDEIRKHAQAECKVTLAGAQ